MTRDEKAIERDVRILRQFTQAYCRQSHGHAADELCPDCRDVLDYAVAKRRGCPMHPKPPCRDCKVHCFREPYREKVRAIMKFGGAHYARRGRIDLLIRMLIDRIAARRRHVEPSTERKT
jgi:hypothetical protein